jgi:transcription elongation factor GreA
VDEHIDRDNIREYVGIAERGGEDFPTEISAAILRTVAKRFPDLSETPNTPFWEEDYIYVTAAGMARQREEYRKLVDEKIPANATAIGAAASLGDLSENSEWESAMEEQRNLTGRAQEMDGELRKARLLEDQEIPVGVVAPGTRVTFQVVGSGEHQSWRVLGPWDAIDDDIVSYRAPLAKDLLGRKVGDKATIQDPSGPKNIRIEKIERLI